MERMESAMRWRWPSCLAHLSGYRLGRHVPERPQRERARAREMMASMSPPRDMFAMMSLMLCRCIARGCACGIQYTWVLFAKDRCLMAMSSLSLPPPPPSPSSPQYTCFFFTTPARCSHLASSSRSFAILLSTWHCNGGGGVSNPCLNQLKVESAP